MEQLEIHQNPKPNTNWILPTLYKIRADGRQQVWNIYFQDGGLFTEYGETNGEMQTAEIDIFTNSSGRSYLDQAIQEARNRYKVKIRDGYLPDDGDEELRLIKAMKSNKYDPGKVLLFPVAWQPKLDGFRIVAYLYRDECKLYSYKNSLYTHFKHMEDDINLFKKYLPKGARILDGEGYNKDLDFNQISSIARSNVNIHKDIELLQYWIYDIVTDIDMPFEERSRILSDAYYEFIEDYPDSCIVLVPTYIAKNEEDVDRRLENSLRKGYEGIMIRCMANGVDENGLKNGKAIKNGKKIYERSLYVFKRCFNIMKYKPVLSEEGTIIDVIPCTGKERDCGRLVVRDNKGRKLIMRPAMTFEERREILRNPKSVIGYRVTFEFQERTNDGMPRFPVGKEIHFGERDEQSDEWNDEWNDEQSDEGEIFSDEEYEEKSGRKNIKMKGIRDYE